MSTRRSASSRRLGVPTASIPSSSTASRATPTGSASPALRHVVDAEGNITRFLEEPIAADARDHADGEELARLKIISGLLGVDLDRLRRREAEEQKRQKRFWIGISTFMAMLAVFALVASGLAWFQREQKREALTKNENLLDKTLERTSKLVSNGVRSVDRHGLPSKFGLSLLQEAQGYFDDMDAIKVTSKQMQLRRAEMLIGLSASYKLLGRGEDALSNSRRARDILNAEVERLQAEGSPVPNEVYYQLARSHIYLARGQADRGWVDFALASSRTGIKILDEHLGVSIQGIPNGCSCAATFFWSLHISTAGAGSGIRPSNTSASAVSSESGSGSMD